jgi:hypothetical protein
MLVIGYQAKVFLTHLCFKNPRRLFSSNTGKIPSWGNDGYLDFLIFWLRLVLQVGCVLILQQQQGQLY